MRFEMASYFEDPEFKRSLQKYEDMVKSHVPAYFDGDELTDIAEYYASKNREADADEAVRFGLTLHPDDIDLLIFKSRSLAIKGKTDEARQVYDLITDRNDREVKFLLFDILLEEGETKKADAVMDNLAAEEEYSMEVMTDIMQIYTDDDLPEKAKVWYERIDKAYDVANLMRTNKRCRSIFCDYFLSMGEDERCIPLLEEMVDEAPYSVGLWNDLARCHLNLGDEEKANEAVDFSLAIDDKDVDALLLKSACCRMTGNVDECIRHLERAVAIGTQFPYADLQLAKTYLDIRRYEKVVEVCEPIDARIDDIDNTFIYNDVNSYLAISYMGTGREEEGIEKLKLVRDLFVNSVNTFLVIIHCALLYKDTATAFEYVDKTLETIDTLPPEKRFQILFETSGLLFDFKELEKAGKVYKVMIRMFPEDSRMVLYLAMYCFAYSRQIPWFYYCFAHIRKDMPEVYAEFGHISEIDDKSYNDLLLNICKAIQQNEFDIDKYLSLPE